MGAAGGDQREREPCCHHTARGKLHYEIHFVLADLPTDRVFGGGSGSGGVGGSMTKFITTFAFETAPPSPLLMILSRSALSGH